MAARAHLLTRVTPSSLPASVALFPLPGSLLYTFHARSRTSSVATDGSDTQPRAPHDRARRPAVEARAADMAKRDARHTIHCAGWHG